MAVTGFASASYPVVDDPLGTNVTSYTVMGWWYFTASTVNQTIFSRGKNTHNESITHGVYRSTGELRFDDYNPFGGVLMSGVVDLVNSWNHIAFVRSTVSPTRQIFINGISVASENNSEAYGGQHSRQFAIGRTLRVMTASYYPATYGTSFDSRVYARPVPVGEILHIVNMRGKDIPYDALLRWGFQDGPAGVSLTGGVVADHTANGNHGVVQGTGLVTAQDPFRTVRPTVWRI